MLQTLRVTNWKAYRDKEISFGPGLNLFVGPNGSGKTTLLDAICLALTGTVPMGDFKSLVRNKNEEAAVELDLTLRNARYSIKRRFTADRLASAEWSNGSGRREQLPWDTLNLALARELKTDPVFFSRIIYMSEVEVFEYVNHPPSDALSSALERVLGIDSLTSVADFAARLGKSYIKAITSLRNDLARPSYPLGQTAIDDNAARVEFDRDKAELEAAWKESEKAQAEVQRLHSIAYILERAQNVVSAFTEACTELGIDPTPPTSSDVAENLNQQALELVRQLDERVGLASSKKVRAESSAEYLVGIQKLLSSVVHMETSAEPLCPVCERPIDRSLAVRLLEKTDSRLAQAQGELADYRADLARSQGELQKAALPPND
jgi:DNA repair exonuclease SbcCD ATPase subunit